MVYRVKVVKSLGGRTVIVSNTKSLDRLLNIAGIKKIISVESDIDGAFSALEEG